MRVDDHDLEDPLELPVGTISFLMTDIEGSTRHWQEDSAGMELALQKHDELAAEIIALRDGVLVKRRGEGDSLFAVFDRPSDAVAAALELQQTLLKEFSEGPVQLLVRIAIHTGEAEHRDGDYFGPAVNRCARLRAVAYGGQVLLSRTVFDLTQDNLPPECSALALGEIKLRDLDRPEEVFQLLHPSLPSDFPRPRSVQANPNNLPAQPSSFVGRSRELASLERLISRERLVTITGPTGAGKTRLALQTAADLLDRFKQGVWLIELAPVVESQLAPGVLATALGVEPASGENPLDAVAEHLKTANVLLILDNCEHLIEECALLIDRLLRSCPNVRILATSQFSLGITGEQTFRLVSLSMPDCMSHPTVEALSTFEAVRLFVDRATEARSSFAVTNQNAPAVAEICHRLDGIPLAIELAAARINVLTAEQIAERLDDRFRLLTGGSRTAMPRHHTLRAAIDWTYELLAADERALLRRLAVFRGGWNLDAAQEICACENVDAYHVLDLLGQLADKSLVHVFEVGEIARYSLLETLRQYAWDRLEEHGATEEVHERHAAYFLRLAGEQCRDCEPVECIARLRQEARNLQAMLEWLRLHTRPAREDVKTAYGWAALAAGSRLAEAGEVEEATPWLEQAAAEFRESNLTTAERHSRRLLATLREETAGAAA
jgi:predicted ATPase/class 3 adenylate cyclase